MWRDGRSDTDTSNAYHHTDVHAFADIHPCTYSYSVPDIHARSDVYASPHGDSNKYGHAHDNANSDSYSNVYSDCHAYTNTEPLGVSHFRPRRSDG